MGIFSGAIDALLGGGLTTIATGAIGAYTKLKEMKLQNEHQKFQMKYEVEMHKLQFQSDKYLGDLNLLIAKEAGANQSFNSAINAEARINDHGLPIAVRSIRTLFRPGLTLFLWGGTLFLAFWAIEMTVINQGIALTFQQGASAASGFWFGSRAVGSDPKR
jgi:hypothetical protein